MQKKGGARLVGHLRNYAFGKPGSTEPDSSGNVESCAPAFWRNSRLPSMVWPSRDVSTEVSPCSVAIKESSTMAEMIIQRKSPSKYSVIRPYRYSYCSMYIYLLQICNTHFVRWISHNDAGLTLQGMHPLQQFPASRVVMPAY
jgi:hypothetical protein